MLQFGHICYFTLLLGIGQDLPPLPPPPHSFFVATWKTINSGKQIKSGRNKPKRWKYSTICPYPCNEKGLTIQVFAMMN